MAYIYEELNEGEVVRRLYADRENNGWSYEACQALAEYLMEICVENDEPWELDVVALRCDWNEYANLEAFQAEYSAEDYPTLDDVKEATSFIHVGEGDGFMVIAI